MRLTSAQSDLIKKNYQDIFKEIVGEHMKWVKGERKRCVDVFTKISEAMKTREPEDYEDVLKVFNQYVEAKMKQWLSWPKCDANNRIGFIDKTENIYIFVTSKTANLEINKDLAIAGTSDKTDWDF